MMKRRQSHIQTRTRRLMRSTSPTTSNKVFFWLLLLVMSCATSSRNSSTGAGGFIMVVVSSFKPIPMLLFRKSIPLLNNNKGRISSSSSSSSTTSPRLSGLKQRMKLIRLLTFMSLSPNQERQQQQEPPQSPKNETSSSSSSSSSSITSTIVATSTDKDSNVNNNNDNSHPNHNNNPLTSVKLPLHFPTEPSTTIPQYDYKDFLPMGNIQSNTLPPPPPPPPYPYDGNDEDGMNTTTTTTRTDSDVTTDDSTTFQQQQQQHEIVELVGGLKFNQQQLRIGKRSRMIRIIRWFITGTSPYPMIQSDEKLQTNLKSLAKLLLLLRVYETLIGIPKFGGPDIQRQVLSDITKGLYNSGAPTWALETVMERVAEGMTGREGVQWMLLPHRCFIFYPHISSSSSSTSSATSTLLSNNPLQSQQRGQQFPSSHQQSPGTDMFKIRPGYHISRLGAVEQVAVRLASFASNTKSVERLTASQFRIPRRDELDTAEMEASKAVTEYLQEQNQNDQSISPDELARTILNLASSTYGLFFYLNSPQLQIAMKNGTSPTSTTSTNSTTNIPEGGINTVGTTTNMPFWHVPDSTREIFTRLAAYEAYQSMETIRQKEEQASKPLYPPRTVSLFRILSSAGACAMWFGGSFWDMLLSGVLAVSVAYIGTFQTLAFEERILTEIVACFFVGLVAGIVSIQFPNQFCFGAIAVASVMDLMQGFKVVYAVIEVMSKNIVTGAARLTEGILFTGLISYSLKFGLDIAVRLMLACGSSTAVNYADMLVSVHGISEKFFPLLLPFAAVAWSGLFQPSYADLPLMSFHGMLAFSLSWAGVPMFWSAMCVTFSAGIISRFTGREALGNTLAGLYALVPGTYMVRALLSPSRVGFIESVLFAAATIGLGGWTGTILCSPTILGKSSGLHGWSFANHPNHNVRNRNNIKNNMPPKGEKKKEPMLYF